jgi:hypothetical protein
MELSLPDRQEPLGSTGSTSLGPSPTWQVTLPGLRGLEPLERLAASVVLGRGLPPPIEEGSPPDRQLFVEALDLEEELTAAGRRSTLVFDNTTGVFLPAELCSAGQAPAAALKEEALGLLTLLGLELAPTLRQLLLEGKAAAALGWVAEASPAYRFEALGAAACGVGAELAEANGKALVLSWVFDSFLLGKAIPVDEEFYLGFTTVERAWVLERGRGFGVRLASGYAYEVPLDYLCTWYDLEAGRRLAAGVAVKVEEASSTEGGVEVRLSSGEVLPLSPTTLLGYCEPDYEDFGFGHDSGRAHAGAWLEARGPFRTLGSED